MQDNNRYIVLFFFFFFKSTNIHSHQRRKNEFFPNIERRDILGIYHSIPITKLILILTETNVLLPRKQTRVKKENTKIIHQILHQIFKQKPNAFKHEEINICPSSAEKIYSPLLIIPLKIPPRFLKNLASGEVKRGILIIYGTEMTRDL